MLRRVLLGEGGAGVAAGTLLMFGLGLVLVLRDAGALKTTLQAEATPLSCARWAAEPARHAWVRVTGCREAGAPRALGADAGVAVALELPDGTRAGWLVPLEGRGGGEDAGTGADGGAATFRQLTGASELREVDGAQAAVLLEGRDPRSPRVLFTAFLGLLLMVWALWPIARRWQLVRESDAQAEALRRRHGGE